MLYQYELKIPLSYNRYDVNEPDPSSEMRFVFKGRPKAYVLDVVFSYMDDDDKVTMQFKDRVTIYLDIEKEDDEKEHPKPYVTCKIQGLLVEDEKYAKEYAEKIINGVCKGLTLLFLRHNSNRHLYQPRVEAKWRDAIWNHHEYQPYVEAISKETVDEKGNRIIYASDRMTFRESLYCFSTVEISADEVNIGDWIKENDGSYTYLMDEFYAALGTEVPKSKFFHLFAMIEFCEREYAEHNGAVRLLSDNEIDNLINSLEEKMKNVGHNKETKTVLSRVKKTLDDSTNIGRTQKLLNILHWMGIEKLGRHFSDILIDKKLLDSLTTLRNKSFHGTNEAEQKYRDANEKLFYICDQILRYVEK